MANLCAGILLLPHDVRKVQDTDGFPSVARGAATTAGVAAFAWNRWQLSPGIGGRLAMESVAAFVWNGWQLCRGISGRIHLESVAALPWNTQSIVEFIITNQAYRQFTDVDLVFSVDDSKSPMTLVSSGIITPISLQHAETVEELPVKNTQTKKFRLKAIPKQYKTEYFDAVFVFDGEKAPSMSVASLSKDVSIRPYQEWKDTANAWLVAIPVVAIVYIVLFTVISLFDHFIGTRRHQKSVGLFGQHASELREQGMLKSADEQAIGDAITVYASFTRPKPHKVWSKIFGAQRFDY